MGLRQAAAVTRHAIGPRHVILRGQGRQGQGKDRRQIRHNTCGQAIRAIVRCDDRAAIGIKRDRLRAHIGANHHLDDARAGVLAQHQRDRGQRQNSGKNSRQEAAQHHRSL